MKLINELKNLNRTEVEKWFFMTRYTWLEKIGGKKKKIFIKLAVKKGKNFKKKLRKNSRKNLMKIFCEKNLKSVFWNQKM